MFAIWTTISTGYEILGFLHILSVIVAFGPIFFYPELQRAGATEVVAKLHVRMCLPALVLVGVFGFALIGASDKVYEFSDAYLGAAMLIWVALVAVSWFLVRPSITDSSESARARFSAGVGITHLLAAVTLFLMVFKPGWP